MRRSPAGWLVGWLAGFVVRLGFSVGVGSAPADPAARVVPISAGVYYTCALTTSRGVKCWGDNSDGALGDGTNTNSNVPVDVTGLTSGVAAISAGLYHACALTTGGAVKCWGDNSHGQLGD